MIYSNNRIFSLNEDTVITDVSEASMMDFVIEARRIDLEVFETVIGHDFYKAYCEAGLLPLDEASGDNKFVTTIKTIGKKIKELFSLFRKKCKEVFANIRIAVNKMRSAIAKAYYSSKDFESAINRFVDRNRKVTIRLSNIFSDKNGSEAMSFLTGKGSYADLVQKFNDDVEKYYNELIKVKPNDSTKSFTVVYNNNDNAKVVESDYESFLKKSQEYIEKSPMSIPISPDFKTNIMNYVSSYKYDDKIYSRTLDNVSLLEKVYHTNVETSANHIISSGKHTEEEVMKAVNTMYGKFSKITTMGANIVKVSTNLIMLVNQEYCSIAKQIAPFKQDTSGNED